MPEILQNLLTVDSLIALVTISALEIVLGIDNIVFIAIVVGKLPEGERDRARKLGLLLAVVTRIGLLLTISWIMRLEAVLFTLLGHGVTGKDVILIAGGLFLLGKATHEIHNKVEGGESAAGEGRPVKAASFAGVIAQILLIDLIFSIDSVVTAVGMTGGEKDKVPIMIGAVLISVGVMLAFSGGLVRFIDKHPTIKMLALSFLLLIGLMLVADGLGHHVPKGYIYFAMAFSLGVESLNLWAKARGKKALGPRP